MWMEKFGEIKWGIESDIAYLSPLKFQTYRAIAYFQFLAKELIIKMRMNQLTINEDSRESDNDKKNHKFIQDD